MKRQLRKLLLVALTLQLCVGGVLGTVPVFAEAKSAQYPADRLPEAVYDVEYTLSKNGNDEAPPSIQFSHEKMGTMDTRVVKANAALLYSAYDAYQPELINFVKYSGKDGIYNAYSSKNKKIGTLTLSKDYNHMSFSVTRDPLFKKKLTATYSASPKKEIKNIKEVYGVYQIEDNQRAKDQFLTINEKGIQIAEREFALKTTKDKLKQAVKIQSKLKDWRLVISGGYKGNILLHANGTMDFELEGNSEYILETNTKKFNTMDEALASKEMKSKIDKEAKFLNDLTGKEIVNAENGGKATLGNQKITCTQILVEGSGDEKPIDFEITGKVFVVDLQSMYSDSDTVQVELLNDKNKQIAVFDIDKKTKKISALRLAYSDRWITF